MTAICESCGMEARLVEKGKLFKLFETCVVGSIKREFVACATTHEVSVDIARAMKKKWKNLKIRGYEEPS